MLPIQTIILKMNIGVKSSVFPGLVIQLKMDEMSGTRLYNHAYYRSSTFDYVDVTNGVSWHYFKETVG